MYIYTLVAHISQDNYFIYCLFLEIKKSMIIITQKTIIDIANTVELLKGVFV